MANCELVVFSLIQEIVVNYYVSKISLDILAKSGFFWAVMDFLHWLIERPKVNKNNYWYLELKVYKNWEISIENSEIIVFFLSQ